MARINNKINLPTNTTDIKMLAKYLYAIGKKKIVTVAEEQELFSSVKSQFSRKKKNSHARDTHTKAALSLYGLIKINDDGSFCVSSLGNEVLNCFAENTNYSYEDRIALMLKVFVRMEIVDISNNRKIHIGFIILKLLCDSELDFYITNQELAHLVMNPLFVSDEQYNKIKQYVLNFRNSNKGIAEFAPQTKATTFMTTFVTNWEFLTSEDVQLTKAQNKLADKYFEAWLKQGNTPDENEYDTSEDTEDNLIFEEDNDETSINSEDVTEGTNKLNASQSNAKRAYHSIIKYRLNPFSAFIAKVYLSLLEGIQIKDYLSYFTDKIKYKNLKTEFCKPLQQIYYGAPGTGKSYDIDRITKTYSTIRTTFHPDSDYSTFVGAYKPTMTKSKVYGAQGPVLDNGSEVEENRITYTFIKQAFLKAYLGAWKKYADGGDEVQPQFLVIEEINRGNCAQIFGDLFQLLDRSSNGFSTYPIEADADLQKEIENAFSEEYEYKIEGDLDVAGAVKGYTSNYGKSLSEDIKSGRVLLLPNNLYIWATMNTSDQSLFPIDSAFKRRWDWKYVRITNGYERDEQGEFRTDEQGNRIPLNWKIKADNNTEVDWWAFVQAIDNEIADKTDSDDKKLGYFFCKPQGDSKTIDVETFVGKVIFYLWNDVFKDEDADIFKLSADKATFDQFYTEDTKTGVTIANAEAVRLFLVDKLHLKPLSNDESEGDEEETSLNGKDNSTYSINGKGEYVKSRVVIESVKEYIRLNQAMSVQDVLNKWQSLDINIPHLIESETDYNQRSEDGKKRAEAVACGDSILYVAIDGFNRSNIDGVVNAINQANLELTIAKLN